MKKQKGLCISHASTKMDRNDLTKFAIANSSKFSLLTQSHFSPSTFTISLFDNYNHVDKNMLSGKSSNHNTFVTLFQRIKKEMKEMKPNRSVVNLAAVNTLNKLTCQELVPFSTEKTLPEPFIVETETYNSNEKKNDNQLKKFLCSCLRRDTDTTEIDLPS